MPETSTKKHHPAITALAIAGAGALAWNAGRLALQLIGPTIPYRLREPIRYPLDSPEFAQFLGILTSSAVCPDTSIDVLHNGSEFYPAELEAIRSARESVQMEFYEFMPGEVARQFVDALTDRARNGVAVHLVVDALGSFRTPNSFFDGLRQAGGQMHWYHPVCFKDFPYINRRTHRKMIVVDSEVGFMGGAGIADHWLKSDMGSPPWRDTMFRVRGSAVLGMVSTLAENWLECSGEILTVPIKINKPGEGDGAMSLVIPSTPEEGATAARVLYQVLLDSARESIQITTPYFLPDRSARHALVRAIKEHGVRVQILTNGRHTDHRSILQLSRTMELELIRAGAEVYEYAPGMIHAKVMVVDGRWNVLGSANFDHRSFALNNEVNLAILDRDLATTLTSQMAEDVSKSQRVTTAILRGRSVSTRIMDNAAWLLRREA